MPPPSVMKFGNNNTYKVFGTAQINFKGIHHFESLYKMMHDWMTSRGFKHFPTGSDNIEDYFQEYILSTGGPKNNWIWWRTMREENKMFNYYMEVNMQVLVMTTKEVVFKGEKIKMNDAEISIFITGYLQVDPNKQWIDKKDHFLEKAYELFKEKEFIGIIDEHETSVGMACMDLFERCKQHLNLMTSISLQKPFHPELGYPQL